MSKQAATDGQLVYLRLEKDLRSGSLADLPPELTTDPQFPNVVDPYTFTPLLALAISWAPVAAVKQLVEAGADPNFEALDGFPALVGAVMAGRTDTGELLQVLLAAGADPDRQGINGWTALHAAANLNDLESASILLQNGANPQVRTGVDLDDTALEEARRVGALRVVALLDGEND